jgi:hypothetical protein
MLEEVSETCGHVAAAGGRITGVGFIVSLVRVRE